MSANMPKVAILLSTYNGEKYIAEQLDSILNQTYSNFTIYLRDDMSSDRTLAILEQYSQLHDNIVLFESKTKLGYPESFYELLRNVVDADYYAFSDQDDIWNSDKIERAVKRMQKCDATRPILYFANYIVCDENLKYIRTSKGPKDKPGFRYSLFAALGLGFTYVINKNGKELITNNRSIKNVTKDVWIGMLCAAFGTIVYDPKPCAQHRRNAGATSSLDTTFWQIQKDRFKKLFLSDGFEYIHNVMVEFSEMFGDDLNKQDKKDIELFVHKNSFVILLKKVFFPHRLRYDIKDEIMLRIVFALGRL